MTGTITFAGSYRKHLEAILSLRDRAVELGVEVLRPQGDEVVSREGAFVRLTGDPETPAAAAAAQIEAIRAADVLYVVNPGGYVGGSTMLEVGFAAALGVPICFAEPPFEPAAARMAYKVGGIQVAVAAAIERHIAPADACLLRELAADRSRLTEGAMRAGASLVARRDGDAIVISERSSGEEIGRVFADGPSDLSDPRIAIIAAGWVQKGPAR